MKQGKFTLPEAEFRKIHRLEPLDGDLHNFRSSNYDEAPDDGVQLHMLTPNSLAQYHRDAPEYILWFADGTPLGWYSHNADLWVLPKLRTGMSSPSLYRISSYIRGLRDGMIAATDLFESI